MKKIYILGGIVVLLLTAYMITKNGGADVREGINQVKEVSNSSSLSLTKQIVLKSAKIDSVDLKNPGYVLIREVYKGKLAQIVEVSELLPEGETLSVQVDLLEIPADDVELIAVVYEDNGDGGFNPMTDIRVDASAVFVSTGEKAPASLFDDTQGDRETVEPSVTVSYENSSYTPVVVTIEKGQTVSFVNNSDILMWVASDSHPTHTALPQFDQFNGSVPGTTYKYTFDEIGTWLYHDHINPTNVGTVVVTPTTEVVLTIPVMDKNKSGYYDTDVGTFAELADSPDVTMINVHVPFYGDIPGTETSVPYNQTKELLAALPKDKNAPIALYCQGGPMSASAAKDLVDAGYTNVSDLTGGMVEYEKSGRTLIK